MLGPFEVRFFVPLAANTGGIWESDPAVTKAHGRPGSSEPVPPWGLEFC